LFKDENKRDDQNGKQPKLGFNNYHFSYQDSIKNNNSALTQQNPFRTNLRSSGESRQNNMDLR